MSRAARNIHTPSESNIVRIRRALHTLGQATRQDLSKATDLSFPTVGNLLDAMEKYGEISMIGYDLSGSGRHPQKYAFNRHYRLGLVMHIEQNTLHHVITDYSGRILLEGAHIINRLEDPEALGKAITEIKHRHPEVYGGAIGIPGVVANGCIRWLHNSIGYENFDLTSYLENQFNLSVTVENDMNCAALGYLNTCLETSAKTVVYLTIGPFGPGAGIISDGRIVRGSTGFSGEVGRIPLYDKDTLLSALYRRVGTTGQPERMTGMPRTLDALARLITSMAVIINPDAVLFCQGELADEDIRLIREKCHEYLPATHIPDISLRDRTRDYRDGLCHLMMERLITGI